MQAAPLRALIALVLALLTLVSSGCRALPSSGGMRADVRGEAPGLLQTSRLQEVAPPGAVIALNQRLAEHQPRVEIVSPADDALLPEGPWTLQLRVSDWPLSETDGLGIGPHLVVQLDQQPALRLSSAEAAASVAMPALQAGSHRLTVYAARPWGEAVKAPGALRQIRLHRVSRNTAELPARGSAQLIVASPAEPAQQEPVLLDWLLLDAPLQHLQNDDARWRLRVSVNGDSVLVDRQTPLWLKGFHPGSNAMQLELLDARGEALNPPFNSLVREVVIGAADWPVWRNPSLTPSQLALLAGEPPPPGPTLQASQPAEALPVPAAEAEPRPEAAAPPQSTPEGASAEERKQDAQPPTLPEPDRDPRPHPPTQSLVGPGIPATAADSADRAGQTEEETPDPASSDDTDTSTDTNPVRAGAGSGSAEEPEPQESAPAPSPPAEPAPQPRTEQRQVEANATAEAPDTTIPLSPAATGATSDPAAMKPAIPPARDLVNADGSLMQPKPRGPLAGLREKLGG